MCPARGLNMAAFFILRPALYNVAAYDKQPNPRDAHSAGWLKR